MSGPAWIECPRCGKTWREDDVEYIHTCTPRDNAAQPDEGREAIAKYLWERDDELSEGFMQDPSWEAATEMRAGYYRAADDILRLARLAGGRRQVSLEQVERAMLDVRADYRPLVPHYWIEQVIERLRC
jgi:hypothetical protein